MNTRNESDYVKKYIVNECSEEEFDTAFELLLSPDATEKYDDVMLEHWKKCTKNVHEQATHIASESSSSEVNKTKKLFIHHPIFKYAAAVAIFVVSIWMFKNISSEKEMTYRRTYTATDNKETIQLDDGSNVILGQGSTLAVSDKFSSKRDLKLEGEATFNVENIENSSFEVHAGKLTVRVIGTSFNIRNFASEPLILLTVSSGKVEAKLGIDNETKSHYLTPDMQLIFNKESKAIKLQNINSQKVLNDKTLYFNETPFELLVTDIQRFYGVKVKVEDSSIYSFRISGEHSNKNLRELLESVCFIYGLEYEQLNEKEIALKYK